MQQTIYVNNLNEKIKKDVLKRGLYAAFGKYGRVIDIVALRGQLRGQAWIVYDDLGAAVSAQREMDGFLLFDKPARVAFAKTKSDIVSRKDGSFVPRDRKKRKAMEDDMDDDVDEVKVEKKTEERRQKPRMITNSDPHNTLFLQALPDGCSEMMLRTLFDQYSGFERIRMVPGRSEIAFVDFVTIEGATIALQSINGFRLSQTDVLHVTYAKR